MRGPAAPALFMPFRPAGEAQLGAPGELGGHVMDRDEDTQVWKSVVRFFKLGVSADLVSLPAIGWPSAELRHPQSLQNATPADMLFQDHLGVIWSLANLFLDTYTPKSCRHTHICTCIHTHTLYPHTQSLTYVHTSPFPDSAWRSPTLGHPKLASYPGVN